MVETGLLDWAGVADRMSVRPAAHRPAGRPRPSDRGRASRPTSRWSTRPASWTVDPSRLASLSRNTPFAGRTLPARVVATFFRGEPTVLDGRDSGRVAVGVSSGWAAKP